MRKALLLVGLILGLGIAARAQVTAQGNNLITPDPWYDVTDAAYGAVGDGTTDDTAAIQLAINTQVASGSGGHIYFPCGKIFKFGTLDLSHSSGVNWLILEFCGTPKPTATLTLSQSYTGIIGHQGRSNGRAASSRIPTTAFDLSAFPNNGSPVVAVAQGLINGFFISGINIGGAPADAIALGTAVGSAPTLVTIQDTVLGEADNSTGACIDSHVGFGLYLTRVYCSGALNVANTGIVSHGTGIIVANDLMLQRRGMYFDGPAPTGLIGTISVSNVYTENLLDTALFTIHTNGYGGDGFNFGPGIYMADPLPGGGLYVIQHTGDSTPVKVQLHGANAFTGAALINGTNVYSTVDGESGIQMTGASLQVTGPGSYFGPGGGGTNNSLVVNQGQVQNPALVVNSMASGEQGDILQIRSAGHGLLGSFFSNKSFGSLYGWALYSGDKQGVLTLPAGGISGNHIYRLPDFGGTVGLNFSASAILTYTAISAQTCQEQKLTVTGATNSGTATASPSASLGDTNLSWAAWISAANTVSVRVCNPGAKSMTPRAVTWQVRVIQ